MNIEMATIAFSYTVDDSNPDYPIIEIERILSVDFKPPECAKPDSVLNLCFIFGISNQHRFEGDNLLEMAETDIAAFLEEEFPNISFKEGTITNHRLIEHGEWKSGTATISFERDPLGVYASLG